MTKRQVPAATGESKQLDLLIVLYLEIEQFGLEIVSAKSWAENDTTGSTEIQDHRTEPPPRTKSHGSPRQFPRRTTGKEGRLPYRKTRWERKSTLGTRD